MLSPLMNEAIAKVEMMPEQAQEAYGAILLAEIASEAKWDDLFARSQDLLAHLAQEAIEEHERGETRPLDEIL